MSNGYDDSNLRKLFEELQPKRRVQAMKGGFRREAYRVRAAAIRNLRSSRIRTDRDLERGVRAIVYRKRLGFRVTIAWQKGSGRNEKGFHTNRRGQKKPVLVWHESGTAERKTKSSFLRKRRGHSTGRMRRSGFMSQTLHQMGDSVTEGLRDELTSYIERTARKYGCN